MGIKMGGFGQASAHVEGFNKRKAAYTFYIKPGGETVVVVLDDVPAEVVRHISYMKGNKGERCTCWGSNPDEYPKPCPRNCVACAAMAKPDSKIGRQGLVHLTIVEERSTTLDNGKQFVNPKYLLELDSDDGAHFSKMKEQYGGLVGARFRVSRGQKTNSPKRGNWMLIDKVDPLRYFWGCPSIRAMIQAAEKRGGKVPTYEEAVRAKIAPYDYPTLFVYDSAEAEAFVLNAGGSVQTTSIQPTDSGDVPPPPPCPRPDYSMSRSDVPSVPPPPPQTTSAPPRTPDPAHATQPASAPPPPPPSGGGAGVPPPPPGVAPSYAPPPPPPQIQPAAAAAPATAAARAPDGGGFQGWDADESALFS
jgi:hypothetical protein